MAAWDDKQCSHVKRVVMISWEGRSLIEHMSNMHYAVTLYLVETLLWSGVLFKSTSNPMIPSEQSLYFFLRPLVTFSRNDCDGLSSNFIGVQCSVVSSRKGSVK